MGMLDFLRGQSWFDQQQPPGPRPLFPPDKQSLFPVQSDPSPVNPNPLQAGWKGLTDWLGAPMDSQAGGADGLLAYKPTSRLDAIGAMLGGASKGILGQRGPYANPLGGALLGASGGLEEAKQKDLQLRQLAQEQQYKAAAANVARLKAEAEAKKADASTRITTKPGETVRDAAGNVLATGGDETTDINGQLVSKRTGEPIGQRINPVPTTAEAAAVQGGPLNPIAQKIVAADIINKTKPVATTVQMSPQYIGAQGETRESQTVGEAAGKEVAQNHAVIGSYPQEVGTLQTLRQLAQAAPTGRFEDAKDYLRAASQAITGKPDANLSTREVFAGLSNKLVKEDLGSLGTAVSNSDVAFASRMAANPGNTKEANLAMLDLREKALQRKLDVANFAEQWRHDNGTIMNADKSGQTYWQALGKRYADKPLFDERLQADVTRRTQGGAAGPAPGTEAY